MLASFQEAACDVLSLKTAKAAHDAGVKTVVMGGGVASNERLRRAVTERCAEKGISVSVPSPGYCTDNGAMVAMAASFYAEEGSSPPSTSRRFRECGGDARGVQVVTREAFKR